MTRAGRGGEAGHRPWKAGSPRHIAYGPAARPGVSSLVPLAVLAATGMRYAMTMPQPG
ncbi:MAG TPA: hypothetical protein VKV38_08030 [Trebonia sp.]|jgi:hypothetical protein|nr:hypothetical protein [Trebonia sp.]